ncbi:conjugal transfer protein TraG N-terminal domain-containing protein, partial [Pseudoalteromonas sp. T1lg23B]|uniref:conjugal transfer protein TraG N-terminal domain-containing protein n=4 Tax=Pseudoalteromonas sp. T1lg23B TaxID=2077097 RepID=UPI0018FEEFFB
MFEIYTFGDAALMKSVLDAVVMVLSAGGLGAGKGIGIAFTIGLLVAGVGTLSSKNFSAFHRFIGAFMIWYFMVGFTYGSTDGTKVDAVIISSSGQTEVVSDAPPGILWVFSTASVLGRELNDLFNTAFSLPNNLAGNYQSTRDPYQALIKFREMKFSSNISNYDGMRRTLAHWYQECANTGAESQNQSIDISSLQFDKSEFLNGLRRGNQNALTTKVYSDNVTGADALNSYDAPFSTENPAMMSCANAQTHILSALDAPEFELALQRNVEVLNKINLTSVVSAMQLMT